MKSIFGTLALSVGLSAFGLGSVAVAQTSYYYAGQTETGQRLIVDLDSISGGGNSDAEFDFFLGDQLISSQAHCLGGAAWTTLDDGMVHYAQSQATREMVRIVCSYLSQSTDIATGPSVVGSPQSAPPPIEPLPPTPPVEVSEPPFIGIESDTAAVPGPVPGPVSVPVAVEPYEPARPALPERPAFSENPAAIQTALVYDPSSNVRATPNGRIICSIDTRAYINIYGRLGDWYNTDACGSLGVIHISQIQF